MKALGKSGTPTRTEAAFASRWIKEYGFTQDIIEEACRRTVMATDKHRFEYADSILTSWYGKKVHNKADIKALDAAHLKKQKAEKPKTAPANKFNNFHQRDYDFEQLEKQLLNT